MKKQLQESQASLLGDIRSLIEAARGRVAQAVNAGLVMLYWSIGRRIRQDILGNKRAKYAQQIVYSLSRQLVSAYGEGFGARNLAYMVRFAEVFPNREILHTLCAKLGWSHFRLIIYLEDDLQRDFYAEMCRLERWSVRALKSRGRPYQGSPPSWPARKWPICGSKTASPRTSSSATPHRAGRGFCRGYYIDLLFYHRGMRRLVAIELKLDRFPGRGQGAAKALPALARQARKAPGGARAASASPGLMEMARHRGNVFLVPRRAVHDRSAGQKHPGGQAA